MQIYFYAEGLMAWACSTSILRVELMSLAGSDSCLMLAVYSRLRSTALGCVLNQHNQTSPGRAPKQEQHVNV